MELVFHSLSNLARKCDQSVSDCVLCKINIVSSFCYSIF